MIWSLLAPGPSATKALAESITGNLGVINNAYELAPWADFIAATDRDWWRHNPKAMECEGQKFSCHIIHGVEKLPISVVNSGVLALECAKRLGATEIRLYGFDMHGTHFFGPYTNGLKNTPPDKRRKHIKQYGYWAKSNRNKIDVINCTPGSVLRCFRMADENFFRTASKPERV